MNDLIFILIIFIAVIFIAGIFINVFNSIYKSLSLKNNNQGDYLKKGFPNFYKFCNDQRELLKMVLNQSDDRTLEFKFPILTFGKVMGYNYLGIRDELGKFYIYLNCESNRGKIIKGKTIQILNDQTFEKYNEQVKELSLYLMSYTEYLNIASGKINFKNSDFVQIKSKDKEIEIKDHINLKSKNDNLKTASIKNKINEKEDQKSVLKDEIKFNQSIRHSINPYVDKNEVPIIIINSVPEASLSQPKRIGYIPSEKFAQTEPYKYAVVKMPKKNSMIKFPRKGRSDIKGFTEDAFFIHLNRHFKTTFNIFNDRHVPTENSWYEPDFVLVSEIDNKNIFINIEIDEPYDGWMRAPTHGIGGRDLVRDDFFTKRGWIVIRFAEKQIHCEPQNCCAFIAKVIHSIDSTFNSDLLNEINPSEITQWNDLQAKKWSLENYREKYLGSINFGKRPNIITQINIKDSEADKIVENQFQKNKISSENGDLPFKNNRDSRIGFDPIEHKYTIDGNPDTISVTQLIDKFFPEFDKLYWSRRKAIERLVSLGIDQSEENILSMQKIILKEWDDKAEDAANKGTALHKEIENYYNEQPYESNTVEFQQFLSFKKRYSSMVQFRSEWRIFDEDLLVAGTIDMVYIKPEDKSLYIFDWKRSEKVVRNDGTIRNDNYQFAFGELGHLGDNSFNKYCLQQNIYRAILEKRYGEKISSMNLLIMHEKFDKYHHIKIPNMDKEVNYIFNYALLRK